MKITPDKYLAQDYEDNGWFTYNTELMGQHTFSKPFEKLTDNLKDYFGKSTWLHWKKDYL